MLNRDYISHEIKHSNLPFRPLPISMYCKVTQDLIPDLTYHPSGLLSRRYVKQVLVLHHVGQSCSYEVMLIEKQVLVLHHVGQSCSYEVMPIEKFMLFHSARPEKNKYFQNIKDYTNMGAI